MAATTDRSRIEKYLNDADFPADKDQLVAVADRNGADQDTLGALRGIPAVDYRNVDEVLASVTHDSDMTPAETAQANTLPDKSGLAQSAKDLPPVNPIVEELGENRGS
jgi:ribosomal protein L12E/L44/L45/RPP1/RPP2